MAVYTIITSVTTSQVAPSTSGRLPTGSQAVQPLGQNNPNSPASAHVFALTVSGPVGVAATVQALGSNDGANWDNYGSTFVATVGASGQPAYKTFSGAIPYAFVSAIVSAISSSAAASVNVSA